MKVEIKIEANLEETQDLEMVRKICRTIDANPVTVKTTDVKRPAPAQDVMRPAPAPALRKTEESDPAVSVQDIRALLASKVDNHREAIRAKLTGLGAKNVTELDARNYDSFYGFLKALA